MENHKQAEAGALHCIRDTSPGAGAALILTVPKRACHNERA
jgi:hypothetical protein